VRWLSGAALSFLTVVLLCGLFAPRIAPHSYDEQFRESPEAPPDRRFPMGTDNLGRDRFSRLVYATRISVVLAPAASGVSVALALIVSILASRRIARTLISGVTTICLSLPWIFLFIVMRAELPLNTGPVASVLATFGLMGVAGWAWPARVFTAAMAEIRDSGWMLQTRAAGISSWRIAAVHAWPHLRAIALAQFRVLIPVYILSEAGLGLLGLGVPDPLPSWGNLLQDLQHPDIVRANPMVLAPLALLILVMISVELLEPPRESFQ